MKQYAKDENKTLRFSMVYRVLLDGIAEDTVLQQQKKKRIRNLQNVTLKRQLYNASVGVNNNNKKCKMLVFFSPFHSRHECHFYCSKRERL